MTSMVDAIGSELSTHARAEEGDESSNTSSFDEENESTFLVLFSYPIQR